ncbi:hypothetical protein HNR60_002533 [Rhodopseudomonas rhenobacensis]|uniref:DUF3298 domain-containing protein n=1 Tax=Rhodopseudomonas rhenobacensis TaxID=87461 RepID=A0A7W7Z4C2_9BRAD|nr:DUF3298 and DUF4163 domain-containing protein [Rhodopseudomonas rhenobacensis]MBB5047776.1 hypothetical protein [Rhodopseudomonas rhenobacensis]
MISFLRGSLVAFAALALLTPAFAEDAKPDFAIANKSIEATVLLDGPIKADPALAADCLAEGKRWAEKYRADADRERKQTPDMFRDGAWTVERKYDVRSLVHDRYISIVRTDYTNTGGVHPNADVDTILWDKTAAKRISIRPFFTETADGGPTMTALRQAVVAALKTEKLKRDIPADADAHWAKPIEPKLTKIGAVTLAPSTEPGKSSGLTFHYPPDAIGPHAEGDYVGFVAWDKLKPYLTPEGVAIFGGARPRSDED